MELLKGLSVFLLVVMLLVVGAMATAGPSDTYVLYPVSADPCANPSVAKSSAVISAATGTTSLVGLTAAKSIYVCSVSAVLSGTTPDFTLVTGTGTLCATGVTSLTGVMKPLTGTWVNLGYGGTVVKSVSAGDICAVMSAGTTAANGIITYVKQ